MSRKKSSDSYENLADSLAEETLQEAADTFFGQRKGIEYEMQIFSQRVRELQKVLTQLQIRQANLHFVLTQDSQDVVDSFYRKIGVDPELVPRPDAGAFHDERLLSAPFAFRVKTRFVKLLSIAYAEFSSHVQAYMHGQSYKDPEDPRCQRVTINYNQVYDFFTQLKEKIRKANQDNSPSQVLQFVKQLDIERSAKESLVGVPMQYTLDQDMAMSVPDFVQSGLKAYPDFPSLEAVKENVKEFALHLYAQHPEHARRVVEKVKTG
ncbi:MAG: hypothetical protein ACQEUB_09885 [Thermodesulfobacteriota bacterium]